MVDYIRDLRPAKWGLGVSLHRGNPKPPVSALGQKQTFRNVRPMSALPPIADIGTHSQDVCFVPKADILRCGETSLFDHLVGSCRLTGWRSRT